MLHTCNTSQDKNTFEKRDIKQKAPDTRSFFQINKN